MPSPKGPCPWRRKPTAPSAATSWTRLALAPQPVYGGSGNPITTPGLVKVFLELTPEYE